MTHTADNTDRQEPHAMRKRLQFWLDDLPWWLWPIKEAVTWTACKTTGHVWITPCHCGEVCAWCLKAKPEPSSVGGTTTSSEEQTHG